MAVEGNSFSEDRLAAARCFAHTMIVVDDEAGDDEVQESEKPNNSGVTQPGRAAARAAADKEEEEGSVSQHWLNAKALIDNSMELGLVCSILRPDKKEDLRERVALVARRADILCFDWEIYDDGGETARGLIRTIVDEDLEHGGRLRLIAIYTGDYNRLTILKSVRGLFDEAELKKYEIKIQNNSEIITNIGLRIVYLAKGHGTKFTDELSHLQVMESELPKRLQKEFSELSGGILANVALATIGSIRDAAHHVIGRFSGDLDGPYLHHRAAIEVPPEAEEYAVDIVLSELKSAIDKDGVAKKFAGIATLKNRLQEFSSSPGKMAVSARKSIKNGLSKDRVNFTISCEDFSKILEDGQKKAWTDALVSPKGLTRKRFMEVFGRFFSGDIKRSAELNLQFASLTGIDQGPLDSNLRLDRHKRPSLGLGCILKDAKCGYWLCLQASCDSVRLTENTPFVFVPLHEAKNDKPDHVIPFSDPNGDAGHLKLDLPNKAYTQIVSLQFSPDETSQTVKATRNQSDMRLYFTDRNGDQYEWLATLKQRRALRTAQGLGVDMSRLGFDEFEPLRK